MKSNIVSGCTYRNQELTTEDIRKIVKRAAVDVKIVGPEVDENTAIAMAVYGLENVIKIAEKLQKTKENK